MVYYYIEISTQKIVSVKSYNLFSDLDAKSPRNNDWFITYIATVGF